MYVKELSPTSVTFGLDINPMKIPVDPNARWYFPEFYQPNESIRVPNWVVSEWSIWRQNEATPWQSPWITMIDGVLTHNEAVEQNVYRYSRKITSSGYNTYYTGVQQEGLTLTQGLVYTEIEVPNQLVSIDYLELQNTVIPAVIEKHDDIMTNYVQNWLGITGKVLCDYIPKLRYTEIYQGNPYFAFLLRISDFTFAYKHISAPPVMNYVTAFNIADIYPEL